MSTDQMADQLVEEENDVAAEIESLRQDVEAYRTAVIKPRFSNLEADIEQASEDRQDIRETIETLQGQVNRLQGKVETLMGVEDEAASNPDKREQDLKHALIREAESRTGDGAGRASMYYEEVQKLFAQLGHGEVKRPECFKAMRDAQDAAGFEETSKTSKHGNQVEAVAVNLSNLAGDQACSNPTTSNGGSTATNAADGGDVPNTR